MAGHYVSFLGLLAFAILFAIGLITAKTLQSDAVRRFFARFKLDTNFIAIVTTILSVSALAFFTVTAINAAGIPLLWTAPVPGVTLSLVQIFLLIALLIGVGRCTCPFPGRSPKSRRVERGIRRQVQGPPLLRNRGPNARFEIRAQLSHAGR